MTRRDDCPFILDLYPYCCSFYIIQYSINIDDRFLISGVTYLFLILIKLTYVTYDNPLESNSP